MQIQTIQDNSNAIRTIRTRFKAFEGIFQVFEKDSNQIRTIRMRF